MRVIWIDRAFQPGEAVKPLGHILNVKVKDDHSSPVVDTELMLIDIHSYHLSCGEASNGEHTLRVRYYAAPTNDILFSQQAPLHTEDDVELFVARFDAKNYYGSTSMTRWGVGKIFTRYGKTFRVARIESLSFEDDSDPKNPIIKIQFQADLLDLPSKKYVKHQRAAQRINKFDIF